MSVRLVLPGDPQDRNASSKGVGEFADLLGTDLVCETYLGPLSRGGAGPGRELDAEDDDVLELAWEGGIVELLRAEDAEAHFREEGPRRGAKGGLEIPVRRTIRSATRGPSVFELVSTRVLRFNPGKEVLGTLAGSTVPKLLQRLEDRKIPTPGLHRVDERGRLAGLVDGSLHSDEPHLVLVHGTFSSTAGAFSDLFGSDDWRRLLEAYPGRILSLEQHTVTQSPARNVLEMMEGLPRGARLHLLSHSRGGLVGDLICRYPFERDEIEQFFGADDQEHVRGELDLLRGVLADKAPRVERFLRVASPAAGTLLASDRLDTYLNVILSVLGKIAGPAQPAVEFVKALAGAILKTRARADQLPGLESMRPSLERGFVPFLNLAEPRGTDLAVIAGDVRGGGFFGRIKDFFSWLYFREDNDFVVDSKSMFRGVPRTSSRGYYYRAPRADHFSYFSEHATRSALVDWLVRGEAAALVPMDADRPYGGLRGAAGARAIPSNHELAKERRDDRPTVFLLPGIMGTHLARDGDRQWINPFRLAWGGMARLEIGAEGVRRDGLVNLAYERLFDRLRRNQHVIHFGYDWRRSVAEAGEQLAAAIRYELEKHPGTPVRILAHSMGGLVARAFILRHTELWERMLALGGRLVMLGTPNFGSYVPAQVFTRRHRLMKTLAAADLRNSLEELTRVVRDFPGLIEMLPSKGELDLLTPDAWAGLDRAFRPTDAALARARGFRMELDQQRLDPRHTVYVAGHADDTPCAMEVSKGEADFPVHGRGDGTVPWEFGLLDGVPTYYVEAEHGQLPNHAAAFDAYEQLLLEGRTRRLPTSPPVTTRGEEAERPRKAPPVEVGFRYYPNEADIYATLGGEAPDPEELEQGPPVHLSVTAAHVRAAQHPVLVGHYRGDDIVSVEWVIDQELGGQLTRDMGLDRYPGELGTVRLYRGHEKFPGAVVVGLGEVGTLHRMGLEEAFVAALTEYALAHLPEEGERQVSLPVSSLLIGTYGGTGINIEESMGALVQAARLTNDALRSQGLARRVAIGAIEIVELYTDVASRAAHAARELAQRSEDRVTAEPLLRVDDTSRRSRPFTPYSSGWSRRLRIRRKGDDLTFEFTTDLARSEPYRRRIQWCHVEPLLSDVTEGDREVASTLFQYLLPHQLVDQAVNMPDLVLDLDKASAAIPWEILDPFSDQSGGRDPMGVRVGLLRTLSLDDSRERPRRSKHRRALVIGEPADVLPPLPGARKEAELVARLLQAHGVRIDAPLLAASRREIFSALFRHEYEIVHIAAHGKYLEGEPDANGNREVRAGVVLAGGCLLTANELQNLRAVPSIVFLNCCHLGRMEDRSEVEPLSRPSRLAASVSEELIGMGVRVVVAAGWAVGDASAAMFADVFYREMLRGRTVMDAVRSARRRAFGFGGIGDLTWGAYQVYGDPGTRLHWAVSPDGETKRAPEEFVSVDEVVEYVSDFVARHRVARDERARAALREELEENEAAIAIRLQGSGAALRALGEAYENLGEYELAAARYEAALAHSDAPMLVVERLANCQDRLAQRIARSGAPDARERADALFEDSFRRLEKLIELGESAERLALIGANWKRRAKGARTADERSSWTLKARDAYRRAFELEPPDRYYPLLNSLALDLCMAKGNVESAQIDELIEIAEAAGAAGDRWGALTVADGELLRFLKTGRGGARKAAREFAEAKGTSTEREDASRLDQIEAIIALATDATVRTRAEQVMKELSALSAES